MDSQKNFEFKDEDLEKVSGGIPAILGNLTDGTDSEGLQRTSRPLVLETEELIEGLTLGNCQIYVKDAKIRPE